MMFVSLGIGAVVAIALIVVVSILTGGRVTPGQNVLVGTRPAAFSEAGLSGGTVRAPWSEHHASVLVFFASWCRPCRSEMPGLAHYLRAHPPAGVTVLGVDALDARPAAEAFVAKTGVPFRVAFDPAGRVVTGIFGFQTVPETVVVDAKGVVTWVKLGATTSADLVRGLRTLRS
jgi:cytochrome c biogenesis protein CcmG, thiol:disulfide interchange protein DsbE